jgi:hypothetical protein
MRDEGGAKEIWRRGTKEVLVRVREPDEMMKIEKEIEEPEERESTEEVKESEEEEEKRETTEQSKEGGKTNDIRRSCNSSKFSITYSSSPSSEERKVKEEVLMEELDLIVVLLKSTIPSNSVPPSISTTLSPEEGEVSLVVADVKE